MQGCFGRAWGNTRRVRARSRSSWGTSTNSSTICLVRAGGVDCLPPTADGPRLPAATTPELRAAEAQVRQIWVKGRHPLGCNPSHNIQNAIDTLSSIRRCLRHPAREPLRFGEVDSFEQNAQRSRRRVPLPRVAIERRQSKPAPFGPFEYQADTNGVPIQRIGARSVANKKDEPVSRKWVPNQARGDHRREAVQRLSITVRLRSSKDGQLRKWPHPIASKRCT